MTFCREPAVAETGKISEETGTLAISPVVASGRVVARKSKINLQGFGLVETDISAPTIAVTDESPKSKLRSKRR